MPPSRCRAISLCRLCQTSFSEPLTRRAVSLRYKSRRGCHGIRCTPLTSLWFVRYHLPWFSVVRHRPVIRIVLLRLPPIEPVFLFYAFCGHLMKG